MEVEDLCIACCSKCYFLSPVPYLQIFYVLSELFALLICDQCFIELYHFLELTDLVLQVALKSVLKYLVFSLVFRIVRLELFKVQFLFDVKELVFAEIRLWLRRLKLFWFSECFLVGELFIIDLVDGLQVLCECLDKFSISFVLLGKGSKVIKPFVFGIKALRLMQNAALCLYFGLVPANLLVDKVVAWLLVDVRVFWLLSFLVLFLSVVGLL